MQGSSPDSNAPAPNGWFLLSAATLALVLVLLIYLYVQKVLALGPLLLTGGVLAFIIWTLIRGWRYAALLQLVLLGVPVFLFTLFKLSPIFAVSGFFYFLLTVRTARVAGFDLLGYVSSFLPAAARAHPKHRALLFVLFVIASLTVFAVGRYLAIQTMIWQAEHPSLISGAPDPAYTERAKRLPDEGSRRVFLIEASGPIELVVGSRFIDYSPRSNADAGITLAVDPLAEGDLRLTGLEGRSFMQSLGPTCLKVLPFYPKGIPCPSAEYWWRFGRAKVTISKAPQRVVLEIGYISDELELWYRRLDP